jgi:hypothetical protein
LRAAAVYSRVSEECGVTISGSSFASHGSNARTGMMLSIRTIAGATISPLTSDKNPRLVFCNPITSPLRWLWIRFDWAMRGDQVRRQAS